MNTKIIDTNLIVRYLINDHPQHYKLARDFFDLVKIGKIKAHLEQTVFTEVVFVLSKIYEVPKDKIKEALSGMLAYKGIYNNEKEVLFDSLVIYTKTNLHIVDCIIAAKARLHNLEIQSFDQELMKYSLKDKV
jgi:predicted nucleic acid-binding protein